MGKAKIMHDGRISVMGKGGKPSKLNPDEEKTIESLDKKDKSAARAKAKRKEAGK